MSKLSYKHEHIYKAVNSNKRVYRCTIEGCPHTMTALFLAGRKAQCAACGNEIIVTDEMLRRTNITCDGCGRKKFMPNLPVSNKPPTPAQVNTLLDRVKQGL